MSFSIVSDWRALAQRTGIPADELERRAQTMARVPFLAWVEANRA